jgi:hypothetical protein
MHYNHINKKYKIINKKPIFGGLPNNQNDENEDNNEDDYNFEPFSTSNTRENEVMPIVIATENENNNNDVVSDDIEYFSSEQPTDETLDTNLSKKEFNDEQVIYIKNKLDILEEKLKLIDNLDDKLKLINNLEGNIKNTFNCSEKNLIHNNNNLLNKLLDIQKILVESEQKKIEEDETQKKANFLKSKIEEFKYETFNKVNKDLKKFDNVLQKLARLSKRHKIKYNKIDYNDIIYKLKYIKYKYKYINIKNNFIK